MTARMENGFFPGILLPTTTLGGCIDVFENAWPDPYQTIEAMEAECSNGSSGLSWKRASTLGAGIYQDKRTNYHLGITNSAIEDDNGVAQAIHNQMYMTLLASSIPYAKSMTLTLFIMSHITCLSIQRGKSTRRMPTELLLQVELFQQLFT